MRKINFRKTSTNSIVYHPRRAVIIASELFNSLFLMFAIAFVASLALLGYWNSQKEAQSLSEVEFRREHFCMQLTLYWEMKHKRPVDAQAIAGNVLTRVSLPEYPDTVCEVVNEIRKNQRGGQTAMYSYIFDGRYIPNYKDESWITAGLIAENVMKAAREGQPYIRSVNYLTKDAYRQTEWAYNWQKHCQIKPIEVPKAHHVFFDKMSPQERADCRAGKKVDSTTAQAQLGIREIPVPTPRPSTDKIADIIKVSAR